MSHPYPPPYGPPAPAPKKRKLWPWLVGGAALLFLIIAISSGGDDPAPPRAPAPAAAPIESAPEGPPVPVDPPAAVGPLTAFGDGTYLVGEDIEAGTYKSPGASDRMVKFCMWNVKDSSGGVLDLGSASQVTEPLRATLKAGTTFQSQGCQDWTKVS